MKKLVSALLFTLCLSPLGFAQFVTNLPGPEILSYWMSQLLVQPESMDNLYFTEKLMEGTYQTVEENRLMMTSEEYKEIYAKEPILNTPETKTTNQYKKANIRIPAGYRIYDVSVRIDKETKKPYLFLENDLISIESNGQDVSFKLDYKIYPAIKIYQNELLEKGYAYEINKKPVKIEVKYDPKYFTLKKVNNYNPNKKVSLRYRGRNITLDTVTMPLLYLEDKEGNEIVFVLEPNFQNLYKDFKFFRKKHKEVKFIDL